MEECTIPNPSDIMKQAFGEAEKPVAVVKKEPRKMMGGKVNYTHFLSIPVGNEDSIKNNYMRLTEQLSSLTKMPVTSLTSPSMLHLTVLMLDLSDPARLAQAQTLLNSLTTKIQQYHLQTPLNLTFKGLYTFQDKNPTSARVLYFDLKQDEGLERLKKLSSFVIGEFVNADIIRKEELSQVKFNSSTGFYEMKFHLTIINSKRAETFNAKPVLDKFKDISLGVLRVSEI